MTLNARQLEVLHALMIAVQEADPWGYTMDALPQGINTADVQELADAIEEAATNV